MLLSVLEKCARDHTLVAWIATEIRRTAPTLSPGDVRRVTASIVKALLDAELVQAGIPDGSGFIAEHVPSKEIARRISERWDLPAESPNEVQYSLWLSATPRGEAVSTAKAGEGVLEGAVAAACRTLACEASA